MRAAINIYFTAILLGLSSFGQSLAKPSKPAKDTSINCDDVKAAYARVAARYAPLAERKKQRASNKSKMIYGQLKLAVAGAPEDALTPPVKVRGVTLPLNAVGGYPKMLGQTYNAEVGMGTPTQYFNLTADTGSMLTWAVQASCEAAKCPGVANKKTYDPAKSRTSKKIRDDHEGYGDGEADLILYNDVVTLDTTVIKGATVGAAISTFERDGFFEHDGLLGLGRKEEADPEPVLETKRSADKKFVDTIAIDLGAHASIEIGGYDFVKYPKLLQLKVEEDDGWMLSKASVTALDAEGTTSVNLLVDTGSSVSTLPASRLSLIMNRPGLNVQNTTTNPIVYWMPCDTKLNVQMILPDGTKVPIKDSDILMQSNDPKMPGCMSLLVGTTDPFFPAVAGTPLLKNLYTVLSRSDSGDWIGLAPLVQEEVAKPKVA